MNGHQRCDLDAEYLPKLEAAMARGAVAAAAPAAAEGAPWYAVQAVPRGEWTAMRELAGLGMEAFLPHFRDRRPMRDRFVIVGVPAFPGYLFARIGEGGFEAVRKAEGVAGLVKVADRFATLPERVMTALIGGCDGFGCLGWLTAPKAEDVVWAVGEVVRLTGGPFAGWSGPVISVDKAGRVGVLMDIFGRSTLATVAPGEVERHSPPRAKPRGRRHQRAATAFSRSAPGESG